MNEHTMMMGSGGRVRLRLHDRENVLLVFDHAGVMAEPFTWGFPTLASWQQFVATVGKFDADLRQHAVTESGVAS